MNTTMRTMRMGLRMGLRTLAAAALLFAGAPAPRAHAAPDPEGACTPANSCAGSCRTSIDFLLCVKDGNELQATRRTELLEPMAVLRQLERFIEADCGDNPDYAVTVRFGGCSGLYLLYNNLVHPEDAPKFLGANNAASGLDEAYESYKRSKAETKVMVVSDPDAPAVKGVPPLFPGEIHAGLTEIISRPFERQGPEQLDTSVPHGIVDRTAGRSPPNLTELARRFPDTPQPDLDIIELQEAGYWEEADALIRTRERELAARDQSNPKAAQAPSSRVEIVPLGAGFVSGRPGEGLPVVDLGAAETPPDGCDVESRCRCESKAWKRACIAVATGEVHREGQITEGIDARKVAGFIERYSRDIQPALDSANASAADSPVFAPPTQETIAMMFDPTQPLPPEVVNFDAQAIVVPTPMPMPVPVTVAAPVSTPSAMPAPTTVAVAPPPMPTPSAMPAPVVTAAAPTTPSAMPQTTVATAAPMPTPSFMPPPMFSTGGMAPMSTTQQTQMMMQMMMMPGGFALSDRTTCTNGTCSTTGSGSGGNGNGTNWRPICDADAGALAAASLIGGAATPQFLLLQGAPIAAGNGGGDAAAAGRAGNCHQCATCGNGGGSGGYGGGACDQVSATVRANNANPDEIRCPTDRYCVTQRIPIVRNPGAGEDWLQDRPNRPGFNIPGLTIPGREGGGRPWRPQNGGGLPFPLVDNDPLTRPRRPLDLDLMDPFRPRPPRQPTEDINCCYQTMQIGHFEVSDGDNRSRICTDMMITGRPENAACADPNQSTLSGFDLEGLDLVVPDRDGGVRPGNFRPSRPLRGGMSLLSVSNRYQMGSVVRKCHYRHAIMEGFWEDQWTGRSRDDPPQERGYWPSVQDYFASSDRAREQLPQLARECRAKIEVANEWFELNTAQYNEFKKSVENGLKNLTLEMLKGLLKEIPLTYQVLPATGPTYTITAGKVETILYKAVIGAVIEGIKSGKVTASNFKDFIKESLGEILKQMLPAKFGAPVIKIAAGVIGDFLSAFFTEEIKRAMEQGNRQGAIQQLTAASNQEPNWLGGLGATLGSALESAATELASGLCKAGAAAAGVPPPFNGAVGGFCKVAADLAIKGGKVIYSGIRFIGCAQDVARCLDNQLLFLAFAGGQDRMMRLTCSARAASQIAQNVINENRLGPLLADDPLLQLPRVPRERPPFRLIVDPESGEGFVLPRRDRLRPADLRLRE